MFFFCSFTFCGAYFVRGYQVPGMLFQLLFATKVQPSLSPSSTLSSRMCLPVYTRDKFVFHSRELLSCWKNPRLYRKITAWIASRSFSAQMLFSTIVERLNTKRGDRAVKNARRACRKYRSIL